MAKSGFWIVGRLTRDAEVKTIPDGTEIARFAVAVDGYKKDDVSFFECQWFKPSGIKNYLKKGKGFLFSGELRQERWEKDGQARSKVVLNVRAVDFVPGDSKQEGPAIERLNREIDNTPTTGYGAPDMSTDIPENEMPF